MLIVLRGWFLGMFVWCVCAWLVACLVPRLLVCPPVHIVIQDDGWTPLLLAVASGHSDVVKLLLAADASVSGTTVRAWSPWGLPALLLCRRVAWSGLGCTGRDQKKEALVCLRPMCKVTLTTMHGMGTHCCDAQKNGWTALAYACLNGDEEMVSLLLEAGADPNQVDPVRCVCGRAGRLQVAYLCSHCVFVSVHWCWCGMHIACGGSRRTTPPRH